MNAPDTLDALTDAAAQLEQTGRLVEAASSYERLLVRFPDQPDSWYNLAHLRRRLHQPEAALAAYQQALDRGVQAPEEVRLNRAVILAEDLERPDDAERELRMALSLNAGYLPAWLNLGNMLEHRGQPGPATSAYENALEIQPHLALALSRLANVRRVDDARDPLITRLQNALARPGISAPERADLGFALGKVLDDARRYDDAFAAYTAANQASRQMAGPRGVRYDAAAQERLVDQIIRAFPTAAHAPAPSNLFEAAPGPAPVFICGMYRSGSTLTEQILGCHSAITPGGELTLLPHAIRDHWGPPAAWSVPPDADRLQPMRQQYMAGLSKLFPRAGMVTDKRLDSFLHIGLIKAMFPAAKIVHARRDAMDNCLALYFLHLGHGMPYALDLLDAAHWYRQYERLMAHWQRLYGPDMHELVYDDLVAEPRAVAGRLLDFLGLPWEDDCLAFQGAGNAVRTASAWQVRQPLYTQSSGRWRHYECHLAGLKRALGRA